jgi:hypothetical protein
MMATRRREYLALVLCYVVIGAKSLQIAPGEQIADGNRVVR